MVYLIQSILDLPIPIHSTYGISIIETIRTQILQSGHDQESQLHVSEPDFVVGEEIGATSGIRKEKI